MNYLKIMMLLTLSQFGTIYSMKRGYQELYPPYQPSEQLPAKPKKRIWQHAHLLKHGIYVATIENYSQQPFRVITVAIEPEGQSNESVAFRTCDEEKAIEVEQVMEDSGELHSKTGYVKPTVVLGDLSTAEGVYLRIEHTKNPALSKVLWITRQIDDKKRACTVNSYFNDARDKKFTENVVNRNNGDAKVITRVHLTINDAMLQNIIAITSTFFCK